jgi:hypothetical protein
MATDVMTLHALHIRLNTLQCARRELASLSSHYEGLQQIGATLKLSADLETQQCIAANLSNVEKQWIDLDTDLHEHVKRLESVSAMWDGVENGMESVLERLRETRSSLSRPLPASYDDLERELRHSQDLQTSLDVYNDKRLELSSIHGHLRNTISTQDTLALEQRLQLLSRLWTEISDQVAVRQRQAKGRLQRWTDFDERCCRLMTAISTRDAVVTNDDELPIEDLIVKIHVTHCSEIDGLKSKIDHLTSSGQQLMQCSSKVRASDIENRLARLTEAWNRLNTRTKMRLQKLEDTLATVSQLERSMQRLRQWLIETEHQLSAPLVYQHCDFIEIEQHITSQQELQKDIERHGIGVSSVINLCEILSRDQDACPSSVEINAINAAKHSLEKRWKSICDTCMYRKVSIEETWALWQEFYEQCHTFFGWLSVVERDIGSINTEGSPLKDEMQLIQRLQRDIDAHRANLDRLCKLYRRLARAGRNDTAGELRQKVDEACRRWEAVSQNVRSSGKQLEAKRTAAMDFDDLLESLTVWLKDVDVRLKPVQHLSEGMDIQSKLAYLKEIEEEIAKHSDQLSKVDRLAEHISKKADKPHAVHVSQSVNNLHRLQNIVFQRHHQLQQRLQAVADEQNATLEVMSSLEQQPADNPRLTAVNDEVDVAFSTSAQYDHCLHFAPDATATRLTTTKVAVPRSVKYHSQKSAKVRHTMPSHELFTAVTLPVETGRNRLFSLEDRSSRKHRPSLTDSGQDDTEEPMSLTLFTDLEAAMDAASTYLLTTEALVDNSSYRGDHATFDRAVLRCKEAIELVYRLAKNAHQHIQLSPTTNARLKGLTNRYRSLQSRVASKQHILQPQSVEPVYDTDKLETWLRDAETALATCQKGPLSSIAELEAAIRQHRELQLQLESRHSSVIVASRQLASGSPTSEHRLRSLSQRFERVSAKTDVWRSELQLALVQCADFHNTIDSLHDWLGRIEVELNSIDPVDVLAIPSQLRRKHSKLKAVKLELDKASPCVALWHDTAKRLLFGIQSVEAERARNRLTHISEQLRHLLRTCASRTEVIAGALSDNHPSAAGDNLRTFRPHIFQSAERRLSANSLLLRQ